MKRRNFIKAIGAAAATWPLVVYAQQLAVPLVGFLSSRTPKDTKDLVAAFRAGLAQNGYVEGRTVAIEYRFARGRYDRLPALAAELASKPIKVLAATGGELSALAAKAATSTIPIVFTTGVDPMKSGLVASYAHPGGNVTGINIVVSALTGKRLGLLHQLIPDATMIAVLLDRKWPATDAEMRAAKQAAQALGLQVRILYVSTDDEIDAAYATIAGEHIAALVIPGSPFFDTRRAKVVGLSARYKVPTMYHLPAYAEAGGLASYGIPIQEGYRLAGDYVARILKGAHPADLPVVEPAKFEFVINLETAKALGITVPPALLVSADKVIE